MSRLGVICAHVAAMPLAAVVAVLLAIAATGAGASARAVDFHYHDTMFVVAHFHIPAVVAGVVLAVACAVRGYGSMNWLVTASCCFLFLHMISAVALSLSSADGAVRAGEFSQVTPLAPELLHLHVLSAVASVSAALLGLGVSLWSSLRGRNAVT